MQNRNRIPISVPRRYHPPHAAPMDLLIDPVVEDFVQPRDVATVEQAETLARHRWRALWQRWKARQPSRMAECRRWASTVVLEHVTPCWRDREAFELALASQDAA